MRRFPLFSEAYEAALFSSDRLPCEMETEQTAPYRGLWPTREAPDFAPLPYDEDDMETARTRPLRIDQLHL